MKPFALFILGVSIPVVASMALAGAESAQGSGTNRLPVPTSVDEPSVLPAAPPMTEGELAAFRASVVRCWNVAAAADDFVQPIVVVRLQLRPDGQPLADSIRLVSSVGGTGLSVVQAYETARRAIIRCGAEGFDLPREKYSQWRDIEITFNPESMWIK